RLPHSRCPSLFPYTTLFRPRQLVPARVVEAGVVHPLRRGGDGGGQVEPPHAVQVDPGRVGGERGPREATTGPRGEVSVIAHIATDRKSTRLNSSHVKISCAV